MSVRATERVARGWSDPRCLWATVFVTGGPLAAALWHYDQPHNQGSALDFALAFPEPAVLDNMRMMICAASASAGASAGHARPNRKGKP